MWYNSLMRRWIRFFLKVTHKIIFSLRNNFDGNFWDISIFKFNIVFAHDNSVYRVGKLWVSLNESPYWILPGLFVNTL